MVLCHVGRIRTATALPQVATDVMLEGSERPQMSNAEMAPLALWSPSTYSRSKMLYVLILAIYALLYHGYHSYMNVKVGNDC